MAFLRSALQFITLCSWALWFGGTIATSVFIGYFFSVLPRAVAGESGSAMFHVFGRYELALAGIALLASGMLLVTFPSKGFIVILTSLVLAGGMAVTFSLGLIPRIEALRNEGKQSTDEFQKLHHKSTVAMGAQAITLLFSGAAILLTLDPLHSPAINLDNENPEVELAARRTSGLSQRV